MDKKEAFKLFVKDHPTLVKHVNDGKKTWQNFYEIYDLYGDNADAWKEYLVPVAATTTALGITDVVNWFKNININSVQTGINNLQRVVGVFQDLSSKNTTTQTPKTEYKPRPLYKHFDD